jgi:hypothetical protein
MNILLLADESPSLRLRALTELDGVAASDPEVKSMRRAIGKSTEVERALATRGPDVPELAYLLCRLSYLRYEGPEIAEIAEEIFDAQEKDGSWPLWPDEGPAKPAAAKPAQAKAKGKRARRVRPRSEGWQMIPLQTSLPLRGLASVGYATDARAERAYEWLLSKRLEDGTWPGDTKADLPVGGKIGGRTPGYRRLPRSPGCRAATTGAVAALSLHPERRSSDDARTALDHLLARETRDEWALGWEVSRLLGLERASGRLTFYARFDLAFLLDIATRCGASTDDPRVADLVEFLEGLKGPYGLWEHHVHPQLSRWLTLDLETSLRRVASGDWAGSDVRVDFAAYPKRRRRN